MLSNTPYLERDNRGRIAAAMLVIVLLTAVNSFFMAFEDAFALTLMLFVISAPVLFSARLAGQAFHPLSYLAFQGLVTYGLPAVVALELGAEELPMAQFLPASILVVTALVACWLGFQGSFGARLAALIPLTAFDASASDRSGSKTFIAGLIIYGLGWLGRLIRAGLGMTHLPTDLGSVFQYKALLDMFSTFATLSFATLLYLLLSKRTPIRGRHIWVVLLLLLEVGAGAQDGGRTQIVIPFFYFMIVYHFAVKHIRWSTLVAVYSLAYLVVAPVLTMYRDAYYLSLRASPEVGISTVITAVDLVFYNVKAGAYQWSTLVREVLVGLGSSTFDGTLRVLEQVPKTTAFQMGGTFIKPLLVLPIPRLLWPNKPIFLSGRDFAIQFWGKGSDQIFGTSMGIGTPAEAYYNFSWFGILLFPLLGILLRFLYERSRMYAHYEQVPVLRSLFILVTMVDFSASITNYVGGALHQAVVYFLFLILLNRSLPRVRFARPTVDVSGSG